MGVEISRRGTRGAGVPRPPGFVVALFEGLSRLMFGLFGARMRVQNRPVLQLETRGARSGAVRRSVVCWFPDRADSWLVVASLAGAARNPAWLHNLSRHPDAVWIEVPGRGRFRVQPESLRGPEREAAWKGVVELAPGYADYQSKTDRVIPSFA